MQDLEKRAQELAELERQEKEKELAIKKEESRELTPTDGNKPAGIDMKSLQQKFFEKQIDDGKSLNEISKDFAKAQATNALLNDDSEDVQKYRQELLEEQKGMLKESFKQDKLGEQTKTLTERQKKAEAFYKSVRPILEFDFSNLIKDDKYLNAPKREYEDRSYGITLMCFMLIFLAVPYFVVSFLLAIFNGINSIFCQIATFGKVAKSITITILVMFFAALVVYISLLGIENIFNVQIFPK